LWASGTKTSPLGLSGPKPVRLRPSKRFPLCQESEPPNLELSRRQVFANAAIAACCVALRSVAQRSAAGGAKRNRLHALDLQHSTSESSASACVSCFASIIARGCSVAPPGRACARLRQSQQNRA